MISATTAILLVSLSALNLNQFESSLIGTEKQLKFISTTSQFMTTTTDYKPENSVEDDDDCCDIVPPSVSN